MLLLSDLHMLLAVHIDFQQIKVNCLVQEKCVLAVCQANLFDFSKEGQSVKILQIPKPVLDAASSTLLRNFLVDIYLLVAMKLLQPPHLLN